MNVELLYKELSYEVQGAAMQVRKNFGPGHKESLYQNAFAEELFLRGIKFKKEKSIHIRSPKTGRIIGTYKPDFVIDDKIIIELKAQEQIPKRAIDQLYDYLRNSDYQLGYFINFASPKLYIKRIIYTNDHKSWRQKKEIVWCLFVFIFVAISVAAASFAMAADKNWAGSGDASTWADQLNWLPSGVPTSADDVTIDLEDASVTAKKTFEAKSLTVGGASTSAFTTDNFIYGTIAPTSTSDDALYIRKDGTATLKGEGTITLKGKFKNTQEALVGEESFIFTLE